MALYYSIVFAILSAEVWKLNKVKTRLIKHFFLLEQITDSCILFILGNVELD